eukprot:gene57817-biopygen116308
MVEMSAPPPPCLVSNNWGGTRVEQWSTTESLGRCNRTLGTVFRRYFTKQHPRFRQEAPGVACAPVGRGLGTALNGALYNAMINPYTVGPMAVTGFTWY